MSQDQKRPLVSIITPTLNSEKFIRDNINCLLSQTYPDIEHIIIDGGSTDSTVSIVKELDPKAVVLSEPDEGISDAFNKGLGLAKGDIIAILNSDDYYADNLVVQRVVDLFASNRDIKVLYGKVRCVHPEMDETLVVYYSEPFSVEKMERKLIIPHPATFMKREVYETVGSFSLDYKICMDHDYLLRVVRIYKPYSVNQVWTVMRLGGVSAKNQYLGHREAYRILRSNGVGVARSLFNLFLRYAMTSISFSLQKIGLTRLLLFYRRQTGQL